MRKQFWRALQIVVIILVSIILGACAGTSSNARGENAANGPGGDPWEPVNRGVFAVNHSLDKVTLKPVARGYREVVPTFVRRGVANFFANLRTPLTIVNQLLQGKGRTALSDTGRLLLNSTVGIGGLFDPATSAGLEEHKEDFGQTLATWGVPEGPFVMVPLLGPRNLRDAVTIPLNLFAHPLFHYDNTSVRDKLWALEAVNVRARLLAADAFLEDSYDPYASIRDAYRQNRQYLIYDGEPPDDYDDFFEEENFVNEEQTVESP